VNYDDHDINLALQLQEIITRTSVAGEKREKTKTKRKENLVMDPNLCSSQLPTAAKLNSIGLTFCYECS